MRSLISCRPMQVIRGLSRCSFTLPPDQAEMLGHVAKRVGASQWAVLSVLLQETLPWLSVGLRSDANASVGVGVCGMRPVRSCAG